MNATPLSIPDVIRFEPKVFGDERGFSYESFKQKSFEHGVARSVRFVQDNQPATAIDWPVNIQPTPSIKDQAAVLLQNAEVFA